MKCYEILSQIRGDNLFQVEDNFLSIINLLITLTEKILFHKIQKFTIQYIIIQIK